MEYKRIKRFSIKKWLNGGNSKLYAIILGILVAAVILILNVARYINTSSDVSRQATTQADAEQQEETNSVDTGSKSYQIKVNISKDFITVYTPDSDHNFTEAYKTFWCAVNTDVTEATSKITAKYIWRRFDNGVYGQYTSKLENSYYIHSVPYYTNDGSQMITEAYNSLGKSATMGSIFLLPDDAKWIYENCGIDTEVVIYADSTETPAIALGAIPAMSQISTTAATTAAQSQTETATATTAPTTAAATETAPTAQATTADTGSSSAAATTAPTTAAGGGTTKASSGTSTTAAH